jgi:hypothetical protein
MSDNQSGPSSEWKKHAVGFRASPAIIALFGAASAVAGIASSNLWVGYIPKAASSAMINTLGNEAAAMWLFTGTIGAVGGIATIVGITWLGNLVGVHEWGRVKNLSKSQGNQLQIGN